MGKEPWSMQKNAKGAGKTERETGTEPAGRAER